MIDSIKKYVQEQNMFAEGDYVVAGVSGGADSICLLCVLLELRLEIPMTIHVVHINHKIREEAGEDAAYVEAFCRERQLPFSLVEADVEQLAAHRASVCMLQRTIPVRKLCAHCAMRLSTAISRLLISLPQSSLFWTKAAKPQAQFL